MNNTLQIAFISVYKDCGYMDIVDTAAEKSMQEAVEEVKLLPDYATKGEVRCFCYCSFQLYVDCIPLYISG